ncbi:MAG TPA: hypothetical protein VJY35_03065 [Candidatus Eisenbacteria bacterium]|nr:hypothetical protein [Candidatus Eisenbacteria bacterium]
MAATPNDSANVLKVKDLLDFAGVPQEMKLWPPDVFAVVGLILLKSGAYTRVMEAWPPNEYLEGTASTWGRTQEDIGKRWRLHMNERGKMPSEVTTQWAAIWESADTPIAAVRDDEKLTLSLLGLCAAADEACNGLGILFKWVSEKDEVVGPPASEVDDSKRKADDLHSKATKKLVGPAATLCLNVDPSRLRVLPKLRTPQTGLTFRSMTHHLSLCPAGDMTPKWLRMTSGPGENRMNVLVVPWPKTIAPSQFRKADNRIGGMSPEFGFFGYEPAEKMEVNQEDLKSVYLNAKEMVGHIDLVVFPELSLSAEQHNTVIELLTGLGTTVIAGVAGQDAQKRPVNYLTLDGPDVVFERMSLLKQHKHHRWRLTRGQIVQYGLGGILEPGVSWWEDIPIGAREVTFVTVNEWLTMCVLLCEDLARQDPIAEIVRAVGPNLVIALLMDGPQLKERWPARYATVLADDPGSSVLTLTSLGMTELCRPPGRKKSRSVGLWKDAATSEPYELEVPTDADALVLSVVVESCKEWSADGRQDLQPMGYPVLAGVHPVAVDRRTRKPWHSPA